MSKENNGGSAFPVSTRRVERYMDEGGCGHERVVTVQEGGMTLRDWFAGQALTGVMLTNPESHATPVAATAYKIADAMLAAREA